MILTDIFLKLLNIFGIHINVKEPKIKTSHNFKQTFKDIKIVRKSKGNNKLKPSINIMALILLILCIFLIIINLENISHNFISKWLFKHNPFPSLIKTQESMDVTLTAILFSIMSFSLSKLIHQWKETRKFRKAKKDIRRKEKILCKMSTKELLDIVKQKDNENYSKLLKENGPCSSHDDEPKNF